MRANSEGWKLTGPEVHPEPGAVYLVAQRREGQQDKGERRDREEVLVLEDAVVVAEEHDDGEHSGAADQDPDRLGGRQVLDAFDVVGKAEDHDEPEAGEQCNYRQEQHVGVGEPDPHEEVDGEEYPGVVGAVDQGRARRLLHEDQGCEPDGGYEQSQDHRQGGSLGHWFLKSCRISSISSCSSS